MFQAIELMTDHQRPAIMHAHGGAKVGMDRRALATIAAGIVLRTYCVRGDRGGWQAHKRPLVAAGG